VDQRAYVLDAGEEPVDLTLVRNIAPRDFNS
jgi:hypothetical protein